MDDFIGRLSHWLIHRPALIRLMTRLHVLVYRLTGGRVGGRMKGVEVLLLEHRGRRSGRTFTVPVYYLPHGDGWAVVASAAGHARDPQWWTNLQAAGGRGRVQVGAARHDVRAHATEGPVREDLWNRFVEVYPSYRSYQEWTDRPIPVVLLQPAA